MKRPIRIEGDVAYVPLTRGQEAVIDVQDLPMVDGLNWCALAAPHTFYAVRFDYSGPKPRTIYLHRVIMGEPEGLHIDHIDGDGLNNRRANMREATNANNGRNQRLRLNNTSGFKGVSWVKNRGRWRASIVLDGKQRYLGSFICPTSAHFAYVKASREMHGEFGRVA